MSQGETVSFENYKQVLQFAIRRETFAHDFYSKALENTKNLATKELLKELAAEELRHRELLEKVLREDRVEGLAKRPPRQDLGIAEYLVYKDVSPDASVQDVLIAAIKFEEGSQRFYSVLQESFAGQEIAELFEWLVHEEQGHKVRLEKEYDQFILTDN